MHLATHVNPEEVIEQLRNDPEESHRQHVFTLNAVATRTAYSTRYASSEEIPKFRIPQLGASAEAVYRLLRDELDLDGIPNLNMASFVGTFMEREAQQLLVENIGKNLADADEYPALMDLHARCISMIANMWHPQPGEQPIGTATTGSSEAIQLGGLAMKRRWQEKRRAEGKDTSKPNILMGANAQVALLKFARYFDVEARILDVSENSHYRLDPNDIKKNVDENTIGIFVILGSTYTGHYEPVEELSRILDQVQEEHGWDIPIHVDAASGGFIAPFTHAGAGGSKWDFELPRVHSINVSGHKFGLVYVGLGWIIWRDRAYLPKDLIFELHYLGGTEESFGLNFSRPGIQVIGQYYNLIRLGFDGYREVMENCLRNARLLSKALERTGYVKQEAISLLLRAKQYIIPNYPLPPKTDNIEILRVVVRESMSGDLIDKLISDIVEVTERVMTSEPIDVAVLQSRPTSLARRHGRLETKLPAKKITKVKAGEKARHPMAKGGHRSVC
ncbi:glutamate decarboxylase [Coccidioides immitis RMSCC 3703]|uniref:Glutamate decarboxylase n=1 Tax=Coccidioides immitis RMSCC 3703 TaxID=454286 RepID=A0A0J8QS21_COCIT|nr:glutamate decarboxylase [Coccidioides immitis RMSCC 3703]